MTYPEVSLFLPLLSTALALTVPVSAILSDELHNGGTKGFRQSVTGAVAVSNPANGAVYTVGTEELTVNKREAQGRGEVYFDGDPAGSIRTWAIYYLDASGDTLGDPEVVTLAYDAHGAGALAGYEGSSLSRLSDPHTDGDDDRHRLSVQVQDAAVDATFVGIAELRNDGQGNNLSTDPDMTILDADSYAAFQALGLDAIVRLDNHRTTLQGDITILDLPVATNGTVAEGAELRWDVTIYDPTVTNCPLRVCDAPSLVPIAEVSYLETVGAVKRRSGQPPAVKLQPVDVTYDTWDATMSLRVDGDLRDMDVSASLDVDGVGGSDVVALDPGWIGVTWETSDCPDWAYECGAEKPDGWHCCAHMQVDIFIDGDCEDCGDYDFVDPTNPPNWVFLADEVLEIEVLDSAGGFVSTHFCTLSPTARTLAGTARTYSLVGECTSSTAGTEVRRIKVDVPQGAVTEGVQFDLEMGGSAFSTENTGGVCSRQGGCSEEATSVLDGSIRIWNDGMLVREAAPIAVTEAEFELPFSFASDVSAMTGALRVGFDDPAYDLTWVGYEDGIRGYQGDRLMRDIAFADVDVVRNQKEHRCGAFGADTRLGIGVLLSECAFAGSY